MFPRIDFGLKRKSFSTGDFSLNKIKSITQIGESEKLDIALYEITHESENDPRVTLTREAFRFMRDNVDTYTSNALIIFRSLNSENYRFSLLTTDYKRVGKKTEKELSNPRRFSFYLGPDAKVKTPEEFLIKKGAVADIEDLKSRFSVEVVNKEFYLKIADLFYRFIKEAKYPRDSRKKEFAVKLIGRIIFCWFLKKKKSANGVPLIPEELLSLKSLEKFKDYFHSVLEPLFFEVLNTPVKERNIQKAFQISEYIDKIPFLNGGLFDPDANDCYHEIGASRGVIIVEDQWFRDFFELLEQYNFTVDESTPLDIELSIDPEMLGRIFENLLAEIDETTGETARNATGSFYTPRPIVEYMVDESIKHHLFSKTSLSEEKINLLVSWNESESKLNKDEIVSAIDALDSMKILDPACGSGAYPMGILQKTVHILEKIDENSKLWKEKMLQKVPAQFRRMVKEKFENEGPAYIHKTGLIENVIYGIDVQQIAVEISKLRVFLSLVVESTVDENKPNMGIHPLPNLEFKFVCADTLTKTNSTQMGLTENAKEISELSELRELYFISFGEDKEHYKKEFGKTQMKLLEFIKSWVGDTSDIQKLASWDPFSIDRADFFDPKWMFGVEGFDIVIGNPPYIQLQNNNGYLGEKYKDQEYVSFAKTGDIYALFYERGNELLKDGGHLCYITSNKWMRAKYGEKLRGYLSEKTIPKILIDFGGYKVFDSATVDTNILLFEKTTHPGKLKACKIEKDFKSSMNIADYFNKNHIDLTGLKSDSWIISSADEALIKRKIEEIGTPLKDWDIQIYRGVLTGFNEAFIIDGATKDQLIAEDPKSAEIIKPILRGRDIKKYKAEFADKWVILAKYGSSEYLEKEYPSVYNHLLKYKNKLEIRGQCRYGGKGNKGMHHWLELDNCPTDNYLSNFEKEKIVWGNLALDAQYALAEKGMFASAPCPVITPGNKYILAVLNSKVADYFIRKLGVTRNGGYFEYKPMFVEKLPVPQISKEQQKPFERLVDYILFLKEKDIHPLFVSMFETVINSLVYDLYFEEETKAHNLYISDFVPKYLVSLKHEMTDDEKIQICEKMYRALKNNDELTRAIINRNNSNLIKTIQGEADVAKN